MRAHDTECRCTRQTAVKVPLGRPYRLLYIEDSPTDVNLVSRALVGFKLDVVMDTVDDGEKAIRYLRREPPYQAALRPDLVLLDLNLPRVLGEEVLKFIKDDDKLRVVPVAVFTSAGTEVLCRPVYYSSANVCLRKPTDLDDFAEVVRMTCLYWFGIATLPE